MAIKTRVEKHVEAVDDLDGTTGATVKTRTFYSPEGVAYQIELSDDNDARIRGELAAVLKDVLAKGRTVKAKRGTVKRGGGTAAKADAQALRAQNRLVKDWGRSNGWTVTDRGAPSKALQAAYLAAQIDGEPSVGEPMFVSPPEFVAA